jgi:hypothetical protein
LFVPQNFMHKGNSYWKSKELISYYMLCCFVVFCYVISQYIPIAHIFILCHYHSVVYLSALYLLCWLFPFLLWWLWKVFFSIKILLFLITATSKTSKWGTPLNKDFWHFEKKDKMESVFSALIESGRKKWARHSSS